MRELSFSQLWPKLVQPQYTTFRFPRRDKDWQVGEVVKVLFKARSPRDRSVLGIGEIVGKVPRWVMEDDPYKLAIDYAATFGIATFTKAEAVADGFTDRAAMLEWISNGCKLRNITQPMNKLTLAWQQVWLNMAEQKPHIAKQWAAQLDKQNVFSLTGRRFQIAIQQDLLTDIHNEAALGNLTL